VRNASNGISIRTILPTKTTPSIMANVHYSFIGDLATSCQNRGFSPQDKNAAFNLSSISRLGRNSLSGTSIRALSTSPKSSMSEGLVPSK